MADKLDFNDILKRGNDRFRQKEKAPPSELFQCAIFYARPVKDEIFEQGQSFVPKRKWWGPWKNDYESIAALDEMLDSQRFIFPFYSKEVFMSQQEATNFLPVFIKQLIRQEKLPPNVIKEDTSIDEEQIRPAIVPLAITILEQDKPEFKASDL